MTTVAKEVATEPKNRRDTQKITRLRIGDEEIQLNADDDDHIDGNLHLAMVEKIRKGKRNTERKNCELRCQLEEVLAVCEHQHHNQTLILPKPTL